MKWIYRFFEHYYNTPVSTTGMGIFRFFFGIVLCFEVYAMFIHRQLIFGAEPYNAYALVVWFGATLCLSLGLFTRMAAALNYIMVLSTISGFTTWEYHFDFVIIGISLMMLFVPVNAGFSLDNLRKKLWFSNTRFEFHPPKVMPLLYPLMLVFVGIALVYFDSIFHKWTSPMWRAGLGVWLPASVPAAIQNNHGVMLDQYGLMVFLGYLTIIFETLFIVLMWFRKLHPILLVIGLGLHIGIIFAFPIPLFGFGFCALYMLLVPESYWAKIGSWFRAKQTGLTVLYDGECPLCLRTKLSIEHLDMRGGVVFKQVQSEADAFPQLNDIPRQEMLDNIYSVDHRGAVYKGVDTYRMVFWHMGWLAPLAFLLWLPPLRQIAQLIYRIVAANRARIDCNEDVCSIPTPHKEPDYDAIKITRDMTWRQLKVAMMGSFLIVVFMIQLGVIVRDSPTFRHQWRAWGMVQQHADFRNASADFFYATRAFAGLTAHGVFMDNHFGGYNHLIGIVYKNPDGSEQWLPISLEDGGHGYLSSGRLWAKWGFRVNGQRISNGRLQNGLRLFTREWAQLNDIPLDDATFDIRVKYFDIPSKWEKGFLNKQLDRPWQPAGQVFWKKGKFRHNLANIETIGPVPPQTEVVEQIDRK